MSKLRPSTFRLGPLDRLVDPGVGDRFAFFQPELLQHAVQPLGTEDAHEIVFQRQQEGRGAGVALAAGPAAQLVVDAPALVAFGAHDMEPAGFENLFPSTSALTWALILSAVA